MNLEAKLAMVGTIFKGFGRYRESLISKNREDDCISIVFEEYRLDYIVGNECCNNIQWYNHDNESVELTSEDEATMLPYLLKLGKLI